MKQNNKTTRPPIVVVLGHIDHGKSSLLEAIRDFKITAKESGGITQHIAAYQIEEQGKKITFLDTPGHEAFLKMRFRGAKVADIAILVIDAAEGVKPQTKEAINHIKKAEVPAVVALNKIDRPEADPEKVKRELAKEDFLVESLGGKIPCLEISAKTKKGIDQLLELINLIAEIEDFKADINQPGQGIVIESHLNSSRGFTATLLLVNGCLKNGDVISTSSAFVKIKNIDNFEGKSIDQAYPSDPIIVFGFNKPPKTGEEFNAFSDLKQAENHVKNFKSQIKEKEIDQVQENNNQQKILKLVLKTDVLGSKEAIEGILNSLPQDKIGLKILKSEVGNINESDVKTAFASQATIMGFRVKADNVAKKIADRDNVRIVYFEVIYDLVERIKLIMEKIVEPEEVRKDIGKLKVLAKFLTEKNRQIIGGKVIEGEVRKGALIEVLRDDQKIGQGRMINLQRNKKPANLIPKQEECGILFEGNVNIEEQDILLFYLIEKVKPI
jgi:translation initiation factor IF-2